MMKRLTAGILAGMLLLTLAACGGAPSSAGGSPSSQAEPETPSSQAEPEEPSSVPEEAASSQSEPEAASEAADPAGADGEAGGSLVVYFSATGNTRRVAEALAQLQGADLWELVPAEPYTEADLNYSDDSCRANREMADPDARPAFTGEPEGLEGYDVIYVGFPIWWGDLPKIFWTFFDAYDLSGKTIAPFCTSGGSGISAAVATIGELEPGAAVTQGLRADPADPQGSLAPWLVETGLAG